jgi:hypothetical protein
LLLVTVLWVVGVVRGGLDKTLETTVNKMQQQDKIQDEILQVKLINYFRVVRP